MEPQRNLLVFRTVFTIHRTIMDCTLSYIVFHYGSSTAHQQKFANRWRVRNLFTVHLKLTAHKIAPYGCSNKWKFNFKPKTKTPLKCHFCVNLPHFFFRKKKVFVFISNCFFPRSMNVLARIMNLAVSKL